jgi:hypothetical protein
LRGVYIYTHRWPVDKHPVADGSTPCHGTNSPPARGGVAAERRGWWERYLVTNASLPARLRHQLAGGRPRVPVTFFLLAQEESSPKKKGAPVRRRYLVNSSRYSCAARQGGAPAQLAHCLRYCSVHRAGVRHEKASVIEACPVLGEIPPPWLRLLGGEQGPQDHRNEVIYAASEYTLLPSPIYDSYTCSKSASHFDL